MTLKESDKRYIVDLQARLTRPPVWRLQRNHRPESGLFDDFLKSIREIEPAMGIVTEDIPDTDLPCLALGDMWRFHAVPDGKKLEMAGEIFLALEGKGPELSAVVQNRWQKLPMAPDLIIFIAPQCPYCPQMVRQLIPLTVIPPQAAITLIDASLFTELSREHEVKAVPTVIVNGIYRLTGAFQLTELMDLVEKTDPAEVPVGVWERMMVEGQAGLLGNLMLIRGEIFPQVLSLLTHKEINIRLGAMVALETVGEEKPGIISAMLPKLWQEYPESDLAVQGDIAYLIGEWGERTWKEPLLSALTAASQPELQEALEEALEKISRKNG